MEYAAHINNEKVQTVQEHSENTAELCRVFCSGINASEIGFLQGLFHDAGKFTAKFDDYIRHKSNDKRGDIDHSYAGARYLTENFGVNFKSVVGIISRTIISHHGLHDWIDNYCRDYFNERISEKSEYRNVEEILDRLCAEKQISDIFEKASLEYKELIRKIKRISPDVESYAFYLGMLERFLQSALIDADRTDTASFMFEKEINEYNDVNGLWKKMRNKMYEKLETFKAKTDAISLQRRSISERCAAFAKNDVKVCRLIVPTGGGKTLSSLRFAIEYCMEHPEQNMKRIIYIAPFMSILEQNSAEIRSIAGDDAFVEHHSNFFSEIDADSNSETYKNYELHTERWDLPVIATTLVQFLNAIFSCKSSCVRRMHRLAGAVIIIDEVQSVPLKCVNMFNLAINFLTNICGATVVLCSATQPLNEETKYPVIIDENKSMTGDYSKDFEVFARTKIIPYVDVCGFTYKETADFCYERYAEEGNLLVVVNTKASALRVYELLKDKCGSDTEIIHLSTNMCPLHRMEKIRYIKKILGSKPVICVTTQLIEAGVDISFKCVVRSIAGLDNAVQAAGRCNRHGEYNKKCPVYIVKIKDEKLGSLKEISVAQNITQQMIEYGEYEDWQSYETVSAFFRQLYKTKEKELSYNVMDGDLPTTLVDLLSLNKLRYNMSKQTSSKYAAQAFKTAGTLFEVIEKNMRDVIVPYNDDAKALISELEKISDKKNLNDLLRKSQKFTVGIYTGTERKLCENHGIRTLDCGVSVVDGSFYNDEVGIILENSEKELYMF